MSLKLMDKEDSKKGENGLVKRSCTIEKLSITMVLLCPYRKKKSSRINHGSRNLEILFTSPECSRELYFAITKLQDIPKNDFIL